MIDPAQALAFSIQSGPGVYAVLLGSGVSRAAGIPTGWEITLDLVGKLRSSLGEVGTPSPEVWYEQKFGVAPEYSDLVEQFAKSREDRQQLLRSYVEPSEEEREEGKKIPTRAHRAIAALASRGFVRVIVTTNFDRLMETALADEGVVPTVLASRDQIQGALPLVHSPCTVLKVHGDYLDTRIRNTEAELDEYPAELDQLLDRILDEFGLVVCGWSAEWDGALRKAFERCLSRRFTTYWTVLSRPSEAAARLIEHRSAEVIQTKGANELFSNLQRHVEAIEEFSKPHPLSTEAAVSSMKKYLPEERYRIRFADLVGRVVDDVVEKTRSDGFSDKSETPTSESVSARLRRYDGACETLVAVASVSGYWAEEEHCGAWRQALQRLVSEVPGEGGETWRYLSRYPATLLLYALGVGAVASSRYRVLKSLLDTPIQGIYEEESTAAWQLAASRVAVGIYRAGSRLEEFLRRRWPLNTWIRESLEACLEKVIPDASTRLATFARFEILVALYCSHRVKGSARPGSVPSGGIFYFFHGPGPETWRRRVEESFESAKADPEFIESGLCGETVEEYERAMAILGNVMAEWSRL